MVHCQLWTNSTTNTFLNQKSLLCGRILFESRVKKNPGQIWPYLFRILFNFFPNFTPNFSFPFFPHNNSWGKCVEQISKDIKDQGEVASVAQEYTPWRGTPYSWRDIGEPVHHTFVNPYTQSRAYTQSRGDQIHIQRVGCLRLFFVTLFHCAGDTVGGDLNTWWVEVWNEFSLPSQTWSWPECTIVVHTGYYHTPSTSHTGHRPASCGCDTAQWIMKQEQLSSATLY